MILRPTLSTNGISVHSSMHKSTAKRMGGQSQGICALETECWRRNAKHCEIPRYEMITNHFSVRRCFDRTIAVAIWLSFE